MAAYPLDMYKKTERLVSGIFSVICTSCTLHKMKAFAPLLAVVTLASAHCK